MALRAGPAYRHGVQSVFRSTFCAALWAIGAASPALADDVPPPNRWPAPFGGRFHANFTIASDYAQNGISNTELGPAFQAGLDYRSPDLLPKGNPSLWIYGYMFGSNVSFQGVGSGVEVDLAGGLKMRLVEGRLGLQLGYIRYLYPSIPASFGYEYGEVEIKADYNFGPVVVEGRLRYSSNGQGGIGQSWNKRALVSAPLPFLKLPFGASMKAYGSLGDFWGEKPEVVGLPAHDYLYWQVGLVTSVWGLDIMAAYTDTSISTEGCGYSRLCEGRAFFSVTKVF